MRKYRCEAKNPAGFQRTYTTDAVQPQLPLLGAMPTGNVPWHNARYMSQAEAFARKNALLKEKTWRSWEPGPSKLFLTTSSSAALALDARLFLKSIRQTQISTSCEGARINNII